MRWESEGRDFQELCVSQKEVEVDQEHERKSDTGAFFLKQADKIFHIKIWLN